MLNHGGGAASSPERIRALILIAAPLLLPLFGPGLAWLHTLVPLSVAYHLVILGGRQGNRTVLQSLLLVGLAALVSRSLLLYFFGLTMVPLGYILAYGVQHRDSVTWTGLKGLTYLVVLWLLLGAYAVMNGEPTPLQMVRDSIDHALTAGELPEQELAAAFENLRNFVNRAWPALFAISLIGLVWLNLLTSHWLLKRRELSPWPELRLWRLPDHFVAMAALALLLLLLRIEPLATIGLNGVLILGFLYFMQGLGVMSFLMAHWSLPPLLRGVCYALVLLQGYGMLLLALLGMAEVRLNLRRRLKPKYPSA